MNNSVSVQPENSTWRLADGVHLKYCLVRKTWLLIAPERIFILNETAAAALTLVDGTRSTIDIAHILAAESYSQSFAIIKLDILNMFLHLSRRRMLFL